MLPQLIAVPPGPAELELVLPPVRELLAGTDVRVALVPATPSSVRQVRAVATDLPQQPGSLVLTTSGSTGDPLGVTIPAAALLASGRAFRAWWASNSGFRPVRPLRWVASLPLTSIGGLMCVVRSLADGGPPLPTPWLGGHQPFTAAALVKLTQQAQEIAGPETGWAISLVPTMLERVLAAGSPATSALARYDVVLIGGAPLAPSLADRALAAGIRVVNSYGMTETCGGAVMDGQPLPGVTVQAVPVAGDPGSPRVGRLQVMGPVVAAGYRDSRRAECWTTDPDTGHRGFLTSDLGWVTDTGRVHVLGRIDDVVQVGGVNVATSAVAGALAGYPGVREAEVVAVPDTRWGARLVAFVVAAPPGDAALAGQLRERVRAGLGRPAVPAEIRFPDDLPRLPSGKPDRQELARRAAE